jgi:hypothetical protein
MDYSIKKMDTNRDGRVSNEEYKQFWRIQRDKADEKYNSMSNHSSTFKSAAVSNHTTSTASSQADQHAPTDPTVSKLAALIKQMDSAKTDAEKEMLKEQIRNHVSAMEEQNKPVPKSVPLPKGVGADGGKSKGVTISAKFQTLGGKGSAVNAASAQSKVLEMNTPKADTFTQPESWGELPGDGTSGADASVLLQSSLMKEESIQNSWDQINKNTQKGKQLMMLFYYYARLAESGDMGAVYQFMKFITYIISKDKAKQQIEMGKKLIELQELSRKWTNQLLDVQSNATDPNASSELMKTMTIVKSETDSIATSQKLISQMMEEFSQVVETLTNTTKGALETEGRILRTVSTFR